MCEALRTSFKIFSAQSALPRALEYQDYRIITDICMLQVVGKSARKLHGKGTVPAAQPSTQQPQPSSQQQLTGTATPPQQRPAPYKRCPSATSLSDSTCSAESEQSMASASGPLHHHHTAQQHHVPSQQQQQQQQSGASSQAAATPARPAAATPPKPAPPRAASLLAKHNAGAATHAGSSRGGPASTAGPTGKQTVSPQVASPQQRADTWAGKVAGTSPKPSNAAGSATGEQCTTSQPSHQRDPPCAKPQARTPTACGAAGRSTSLPALDAAPQPTAANELAAARADAAVARRECLLLAAEVERLQTALACSEAARQQEVARLLQKAAHHESLVRRSPLVILIYEGIQWVCGCAVSHVQHSDIRSSLHADVMCSMSVKQRRASCSCLHFLKLLHCPLPAISMCPPTVKTAFRQANRWAHFLSNTLCFRRWRRRCDRRRLRWRGGC